MDIPREPEAIRRSYGAKTGRGQLREQLLGRATSGRAWRAFHPALRSGLGFARDNSPRTHSTWGSRRDAAAWISRSPRCSADLKARGLLEETLVVWGGEFGRTPMREMRQTTKFVGRDHHPSAFTSVDGGRRHQVRD